jgi:hypothetical protein
MLADLVPNCRGKELHKLDVLQETVAYVQQLKGLVSADNATVITQIMPAKRTAQDTTEKTALHVAPMSPSPSDSSSSHEHSSSSKSSSSCDQMRVNFLLS